MRTSVFAGIVFSLVFFGSGCSGSSSGHLQKSNEYSSPSVDSYPYGADDEVAIIEPENPFDEGSGHYAGYEWAKENDVSSCDGNSQSFIEGCEEYIGQIEERDTE